jgi:hypothetical protein
MPRPILILIVAVVVLLAVLLGLAMLDREVPTGHVERPLSNVTAQ